MSQSSAAPTSPIVEVPSIPAREIAPWALFFGLLGLLVLFFISADQGAVSIPSGNAIHEWVHDSRHLLGYPCH
ncbi:CbtB-domain containing protein [Nocardioides sp. YIM 152315]|uniref:CbtB domain-containing protein n=1 Tax=Nocardioides sp. YIM 152315 TaxID=3031760 RepID=UPI0023DC2D6C|nr:CbtB-domain containing protein [Nocardioides sp. YIM 152315]MDF1601996.1 CbtB-domain containing protein [Nocardioides sp. YIM 152315]